MLFSFGGCCLMRFIVTFRDMFVQYYVAFYLTVYAIPTSNKKKLLGQICSLRGTSLVVGEMKLRKVSYGP